MRDELGVDIKALMKILDSRLFLRDETSSSSGDDNDEKKKQKHMQGNPDIVDSSSLSSSSSSSQPPSPKLPHHSKSISDLSLTPSNSSPPPPASLGPSPPPPLPPPNNTKPNPTTTPQPEEDPTPLTYPEGGLRANLVVLGSFSGMVAGFGLVNSVGTFQAYVATHQLREYSPSAVGWIFGLYLFLAFFGGVRVGPVFDDRGPRGLVLGGSVCLVVGMVGVASSTGRLGGYGLVFFGFFFGFLFGWSRCVYVLLGFSVLLLWGKKCK